MPRKRPLSDQFTASLKLVCPDSQCGKEFSKDQEWLRRHHRIDRPVCGWPVAASELDILRLRGQQVKDITEAIDRMRRGSAKDGD